MSNAPVPRQPDVVKILTLFNKRIRRLEIGRTNIRCGIAVYTADPPDTASATWTPNFSSATQVEDTIGCQAVEQGLVIPPYWFWWAAVVFTVVSATPPPTGEALVWNATMDGTFSGSSTLTFGEYRTDPLYDTSGEDATAQVFGATPFGATGGFADAGVIVPETATLMGTEFTPKAFGIAVTGIQLFTEDFPHGSGEG